VNEGQREGEADGKPAFDDSLAAALLGKCVLVGLTYEKQDGTVTEQRQLHGTVVAADRSGIRLTLLGGELGSTFNLPPDTRAFSPAPPGEYRLRSTGEIVVDPDYLSTWTIVAPAEA
jgi:hypothetical protein